MAERTSPAQVGREPDSELNNVANYDKILTNQVHSRILE